MFKGHASRSGSGWPYRWVIHQCRYSVSALTMLRELSISPSVEGSFSTYHAPPRCWTSRCGSRGHSFLLSMTSVIANDLAVTTVPPYRGERCRVRSGRLPFPSTRLVLASLFIPAPTKCLGTGLTCSLLLQLHQQTGLHTSRRVPVRTPATNREL